MLISIITPVYNTKKYLENCIKSVMAQTYDNFEFILVNDGSTDGSGKLCDDYAKGDSRITVLHQENTGQGEARNRAIAYAHGEYIVFLDSDDFLNKGLLQYLAEVISKYSPELIIYGNVKCNERNKNKILAAARETKVREEILDKEKLWTEFLEKTTIGGWVGDKCIKRSFLVQKGISFPIIRAREDAYFCNTLFKQVKHAVLTDYIGYYQVLRYGSTEQQPFSKDFLISVDIGERNLRYVCDTFPQLYSAAYRKLIINKLNCLKCMQADGKTEAYVLESRNMKESLRKDLENIKNKKDFTVECEQIIAAISNSKEWRRGCRLLGLSRRKNRLKRFLYSKIF